LEKTRKRLIVKKVFKSPLIPLFLRGRLVGSHFFGEYQLLPLKRETGEGFGGRKESGGGEGVGAFRYKLVKRVKQ
jgi:hypothetical protein